MTTTRTHHRPLRTVSGAAAAALLVAVLAGCSSSGSKASGDITGAQTAAPTSTSSSPSAAPSTSPGATAPTFAFPADVSVKLDGFTDADPAKGAALRDLGYAMTAYEEGLATAATDKPALARYWYGLAAGAVTKSITDYKAAGHRITGTSHFLKPNLVLKDPTSASARLCEDQSASFPKDLTTGAVATGSPSDDDYVAWTLTLQHNAAGDWQVSAADWTHGAKECKP
ncbi:hypothetical protein ACFW1A_00605 [Kitasatospora sp. NPDC058965]|uniref:hypothetical protein n=1 Tax=Kitasatospora sp. NPDC058965 TaxID=3346682 RepID=UPI0036A59575